MVSTEDGLRPISEIVIGDWVWAYHEGTGEYGLFPVTDVIVHTDPAQVHLLLDGELLETTPEHPFYTLERGWVDAGDLWVGAHIRQANGSYGRVQFLAVEREAQVMYNLTVDEAHTFFVGAQRWLVHNSGCGRLIVEEGPDRYLIYDENFPNELYAEGVLRNGVLHLNFATKTLTDIRNPGLRGQEQFEKIVNKFKGRVQAIRGGWVERDNLNGFNRLIQEGKTVEEAALGTWTGQQAQRLGFNQVEIQDLVEGPDGDYELVRVLFKP